MIHKTLLISMSLLVLFAGGCTSSEKEGGTAQPPPVSVGPLPPTLVEASPMPGSELALDGSISFYFNQPMNRASVEAALSGEPGLSGSFNWVDDATLSFTPSSPWLPDTQLSITIAESAQAANDLTMQEPISLDYKTVGYLALTQSLPEHGTFDVDPTSAIVAAFNQPVVPLGADPDSLPLGFSLLPAAPGRGEWLNTSTYIFYPDPGLDGGLVYSVIIDSNLRSTNGAPLKEVPTWSFHTALPEVLSSTPNANTVNNRLDEEVVITFNQPMDTDSVKNNFSLIGPSGQVSGSFSWDNVNTIVTFTPDSLLQRGASYTYSLEPQAAARGGTWLGTRFSVSFSAVGDFGIQKTTPERNGSKAYYDPVSLVFNAPVDVDDPSEYITIDPEFGGSFDSNENTIWAFGVFESGTNYRVTVSGNLKDIWGDSLGEDYVFEFHASPPNPQLLISTFLGGDVLFVDPDDPVITAQATGISSVNVSVDDISLPDFFELNRSDAYAVRQDFFPAGAQTYPVALNVSQDRSQVVQLPLTANRSSLSPNVYWFSTYAPQLAINYQSGITKGFVVASHVNLVYKVSQTDILVWAVDLRNGSPVAGQNVVIYAESGQPLATGQTDANGVFQANINPPEDRYALSYAVLGSPGDDLFSLATSSWGNGIDAYQYGYISSYTPPQTTYYIYTDRPIYRPGHEVNFRVITRRAYNGRYQMSGENTVSLTIQDGIGAEIGKMTLPMTEYGTAYGTYTLSSEAAPGYYSLHVDDSYDSVLFQVSEYRKPEIDIQVAFDQDEVMAGDSLTGEVSTRYFFDAPAGDLPLDWNLYKQDSYFSIPGYITGPISGTWGGWYIPSDAIGTWIDGGSGTTTADGTYSIDVEAQEDEEGIQTYTLETIVTDESGFPVAYRASATVHPAPFYIGVKPDTWVGRAETEMSFDVLTVNWDRDPIAAQNLTATFSEVEWVKGPRDRFGTYTYERRLTEVSSGAFFTDGQGQARLPFTPPSPGVYQLDVRGGGALTQLLIWVGGVERAVWPNFDDNQLRLTPDKQDYQVGETAEVFIPNPFEGDSIALVSIERGIVISSQVIELTGAGTSFPVTLSADTAPNVYLAVTVVGTEENGAPGFRHGLTLLKVEPTQQELIVAVVSQPERTAPGGTVEFTIQVTDSTGTPVQGEFSLAVVDEAVLALADPFEKDISSAFYGVQPLGVRTNASLVASAAKFKEFFGGMGGGGGGGPIPAPLRSDFKDTAYWNAQIVTDAKGTAQVEAQLPDNLTTWQVLVRGLTKDTLVGEALSEVVTTKELIIRPVTPRFTVVGDHLQIGAVVHNNSKDDLTVDIALQTKGFSLDDSSSALQQVEIESGGRARVDWWGTVEDSAAVELVFFAEGGDYKDLTLPAAGTLPIKHYVAKQSFATSGIMTAGGERLELVSLPRTFDPSGGGLSIELSSSLAGAILEGLQVLEEYPFECTEQTVSRFLPNLETYLTIQQFGLDVPTIEARLQRTLMDGIIKLESDQHYDGGWGWTISGNQESNPYVSAYALLGLVRAQQAGYTLQPYTIENATNYLIDYLGANQANMDQPWEYDRAAFIHYALTQANSPVIDLAFSLYDHRQQMNPWAQALLALSLDTFTPGDDRASTLFSNLESTAIRSATGAHWDENNPGWQNMSSNLFNNAVVIYALAQYDPATPLLADAVRYMMANRDAAGAWYSTYTTAWTIMGLSETMKGTGELGGEFAFSATLNDIPIATGQASGTDQLTPVSVDVGLDRLLTDEPNALKFLRDPGTGRLYYRATLEVHQPVSEVAPLNRGITVSRAYYPTDRDCVTEKCDPLTGAKMGDLVNVRLTLTLPDSAYYLAVEDYIPAGTEVLDTSLKTSQLGDTPDTDLFDARNPFEGGWGWWYFGTPHIYDDHIGWMANFLPAGTYELTYTLVVLQPGSYSVLPAQAWQFYFPEVQGNSAGVVFEITP